MNLCIPQKVRSYYIVPSCHLIRTFEITPLIFTLYMEFRSSSDLFFISIIHPFKFLSNSGTSCELFMTLDKGMFLLKYLLSKSYKAVAFGAVVFVSSRIFVYSNEIWIALGIILIRLFFFKSIPYVFVITLCKIFSGFNFEIWFGY